MQAVFDLPEPPYLPTGVWKPIDYRLSILWRYNQLINAVGNLPSHSPVKLSQSKPYWMLAADLIAQPDGINWYLAGDSAQSGWFDLPAHHTADTMVPQGGE